MDTTFEHYELDGVAHPGRDDYRKGTRDGNAGLWHRSRAGSVVTHSSTKSMQFPATSVLGSTFETASACNTTRQTGSSSIVTTLAIPMGPSSRSAS